MTYKIKIKRKDGSLMYANAGSKERMHAYIKTAKKYGDKIISVHEIDEKGNVLKDITKLVVIGAVATIGLGILGAMMGGNK